jgi:hypothetical protein
MKPSKDERVILFNTRAEQVPEEIHTWYFLIINEPKMIARIRERVFEQLSPVNELKEYRDETIPGKDLRVLCFSFESPQTILDFQLAYKGRWKRAQELYARPGLDKLIDRLIS